MPLERPPLATVLAEVQAAIEARLPGADATPRQSTLGALAVVWAGGLFGLGDYITRLAAQILPATADADWLDRHGQVWGVTRRVAAYATGLVRFSGAEAVIIPAGTRLRRTGGLEYITDAAVAIVGGVATVPVAAVAPGVAGNCAAGLALTLTSPIAGITAAAVHDGGLAAGNEPETDAAYRARILARIQNPPSGGSAADYRSWALAQAGVTRVWVEGGDGSNIVIVRLMMDALFPGTVPDQTALARIAAAIDVLRPVTADVRVQAPELWPVAVTLALEPDTETARAVVAVALAELFVRDATPGGVIPLSRLYGAISGSAGIRDYVLTTPAADLTPPAGALPVLGPVTFEAMA